MPNFEDSPKLAAQRRAKSTMRGPGTAPLEDHQYEAAGSTKGLTGSDGSGVNYGAKGRVNKPVDLSTMAYVDPTQTESSDDFVARARQLNQAIKAAWFEDRIQQAAAAEFQSQWFAGGATAGPGVAAQGPTSDARNRHFGSDGTVNAASGSVGKNVGLPKGQRAPGLNDPGRSHGGGGAASGPCMSWEMFADLYQAYGPFGLMDSFSPNTAVMGPDGTPMSLGYALQMVGSDNWTGNQNMQNLPGAGHIR